MARTGPRPNYGLGRRVGVNGYIDLWIPRHPLARADGYVSEHRYRAWEAGLLTDPALQVHHRNGDKSDNRIENLEVVTIEEHARLHWDERRPDCCPQGHEYTEENTWRNTNGWRQCRACNRERAAGARSLAASAIGELRESVGSGEAAFRCKDPEAGWIADQEEQSRG